MVDDCLPTVCILVPCYNERAGIRRSLESLCQIDYPQSRFEIVVIDGGSDDGTREIIEELLGRFANLRLLYNAVRLKPHGLNLAIQRTQSDIVIRADAHAAYSAGYVRRLVEDLEKYDADNTGGIRETYVGGSRMARAIAIVISHRFGAGDAHYRVGSSRVRSVETVFGGCYRREVFSRIGLFNERLIRTQDREFNRRLLAAGGRIILDPDVRCTYYARERAMDYWRWNWEGAFWVFYARRFTDVSMASGRNFVPIGFVAWHAAIGIAAGFAFPGWAWMLLPLGLYWIVSLSLSFSAAARKRDLALVPYIVFAFAMTHFGYGLASLQGIFRAIREGKDRARERTNVR